MSLYCLVIKNYKRDNSEGTWTKERISIVTVPDRVAGKGHSQWV